MGYAEANTGLTTWSSDNIPKDSALRFYSFVSGIGDIKNDLKTFHSNASTGEKIKARLDIAVQASTDISLADGVGEALRVGEVGEKVLAKLTEQEAETVTEKTADLGAKGTGDVASRNTSHTVEVSISRSDYPEIANHWSEAQQNGHPDTLTIDRPGATTRRNESLQNVSTVKGKDRDEYPPAMFKEGGKGASVKYTDPYQNRSAGAKVMQQLRPHPDGTKVKITITD